MAKQKLFFTGKNREDYCQIIKKLNVHRIKRRTLAVKYRFFIFSISEHSVFAVTNVTFGTAKNSYVSMCVDGAEWLQNSYRANQYFQPLFNISPTAYECVLFMSNVHKTLITVNNLKIKQYKYPVHININASRLSFVIEFLNLFFRCLRVENTIKFLQNMIKSQICNLRSTQPPNVQQSGFVVDKILRDEESWKNHIEPQCTKFYMESLIPEIIDSRITYKIWFTGTIIFVFAVKLRRRV
ncbi:hypothetical protein AGLY_003560 [Aphis glycines]|uniref:Uncharacterized protein n=1 Tax=Aphis glycines TaxID=307491 RepID=A0A6G0TYJ3_APHGL|nr:hypothetical protein AGLY_003560 [Aphis glycines]